MKTDEETMAKVFYRKGAYDGRLHGYIAKAILTSEGGILFFVPIDEQLEEKVLVEELGFKIRKT